ncbi:phosphatidate cytidylyltransferase, partial [Streptomyces shenzhenensis]
MNDSSWGAPPQAGYWGPTDHGPGQGYGRAAAPAGPAYDAHDAQQTRPMPIVPDDVPAHGGDQDRGRGGARARGPPAPGARLHTGGGPQPGEPPP